VKGRSLEEEADADRGRVLFSAPFRRLQNKAQVFSLETNAAVRSRLTHSLEVSSIGRFVAQRAINGFSDRKRQALGLFGEERVFITFVETACLLHDLGNPPFGHFGELAISDWFHLHSGELTPPDIADKQRDRWLKYFGDFLRFDGNPQGFRICTKLQPQETGDLSGMNLTATTLAATMKYPWTSDALGQSRKKAGYFHTERKVVEWLEHELGIQPERRHPLVYLVEAADDIAYCVSDIEDGIEKGLVVARQFAEFMEKRLAKSPSWNAASSANTGDKKDLADVGRALDRLKEPRFTRAADGADVKRLTAMQDFRSGVIRLLARHAGVEFRRSHKGVLAGDAEPLLRDGDGAPILSALKEFAGAALYSSTIVRNRELTAQAVLNGLLDAYLPIMNCDKKDRFDHILAGRLKDGHDRSIARDSSLMSRVAAKYLSIYHEELEHLDTADKNDPGMFTVMERIFRMRLIIDYVTGMTDEFALQSYHLITGVQINPCR